MLSISKSATVIDTVIVCEKNDRQIDTVFYDITFQSAGNRTVAATAYVGAKLRPSAQAAIHVLARPIPNQPPVITITGNRSITAGDTCRLTVTATDPDSGQSVSIEASGMSASATFSEQTFSWATTISDTGIDTVTFIARDDGSPIRFDTEVVIITISPSVINRAPQFSSDTVFLAGHPEDSMTLDYNMPPMINDTAVTANRNEAKTWTLHAQSIDGDSLTWSRLTSPSALSGMVTGTLPTITFTPSSNWSGVDSFYVRATDGFWSDTAKIRITVLNIEVAPVILTQPESFIKTAGQTAMFFVVINGDVNPAPEFQWKKNGAAIPVANASSYTIGSVAPSDSGRYTVTISNSAGTVTSQPAVLTVHFAPQITAQPQSQTLHLGQTATFTVAATGNPAPAYQWTKNGNALAGATSASYTIASPGISDSGRYVVVVRNSVDTVTSDTARFFPRIKCMTGGGSHSLFLKTDGTLWSCGDNTAGQLGDGSKNQSLVPKLIMTGVNAIAAGHEHTLILKTDKTLYSCGINDNGQLGDGTTFPREEPFFIMANVKAIAAGDFFSFMLKEDGTLYTCGSNSAGQLGDGSTDDVLTPKQIMTGVQNIAVGGAHGLMLTNTGFLLSCGFNLSGQLGDSTTSERHLPKAIMSGVQNMSAGGAHTLILTASGTLLSCGDNSSGQLGDGSTNSDSIPKQIMTGIQTIAAGGAHSLIINTSGTLYGFGSNNDWQLGDTNGIVQYSPVQIMSDVDCIAAGANHSFILKKDGRMFGCGNNSAGQIGNNTTSRKQSLTEIAF
ncbi:MAG: immunoglobulin domain-containing protein [Chitinispirillaceae bacterium]|nr:immunoglobulin domain-containing protein [Chitinispirillaceae bacterium]